ncbi:MAG: hypothetical protein H0T57_11620 [Rubrobacter sp.]|nr:hypothetical protein [Rubrobacter sp.]
MTLALVLFVAAPASAQRDAEAGQEKSESPAVEVTGVIEEPEITTYMYGSHAVTDEASGERYALRSEEEGLLGDSTDRRATISGTLVPGYENGAIEGGPPLIEIDEVRPAAGNRDDNTSGADVNGDGVVNEADGELAAAVSDAARSNSENAGQPVLPATGGPVLALLGVALVLLGAGLPLYRALR